MTKIKIIGVYQGVDSAVSAAASADYFVLVTIGKTADGRIFVLDIFRQRNVSFHEQVSIIINKAAEFKPLKIGIESNSFQAFLSQELQRLTLLPIIPITTVRDKVIRAQARSALFETHRVYISPSMHSFIEEFVLFPDGEHDDVVDGFLFALDVAEDVQQEYRGDGNYFIPEFNDF